VQAPRQGLILAPAPLLINQHRHPVEEAQFAGIRILLLSLQSVGHAVQPHRHQFLYHGFL
jgi:hypothetical protein